MLTNLKNKIFSLFKKQNDDVSEDIKSQIEVEIIWEDLTRESIFKSALCRNGIYGYATESLLVLEDGSTYYPLELSDHWEAYINSKKFKPKTIVYNLSNN